VDFLSRSLAFFQWEIHYNWEIFVGHVFFGGLLDRKIPYPLKPLTLNFMNLRLGSASYGIFIGKNNSVQKWSE
jgi:hypothetical protein